MESVRDSIESVLCAGWSEASGIYTRTGASGESRRVSVEYNRQGVKVVVDKSVMYGFFIKSETLGVHIDRPGSGHVLRKHQTLLNGQNALRTLCDELRRA